MTAPGPLRSPTMAAPNPLKRPLAAVSTATAAPESSSKKPNLGGASNLSSFSSSKKPNLGDASNLSSFSSSKKPNLGDASNLSSLWKKKGNLPLKRCLNSADATATAPTAKKPNLADKDFQPRSYQKAVYEVALRRNTIAVLGTGAGKTLIAVMLIREMGKDLPVPGNRRLIVFLAPTVHLVIQQSGVIRAQTDMNVGLYYGDLGVDNWNASRWEEEIATHQVLVMTPQILLGALRKAFLTLDLVRLLIFDECHRATGNHPYTRIMKDFYHKSSQKSHVFGMTASPVIRKGVSSTIDCEDQLFNLEGILDSKIYTVADRTEMNSIVPEATELTQYYNPKLCIYEDLKTKLASLWAKFDATLSSLQESTLCQYKDADNIIKASRKRLSNCHAKICLCLDDLGLICANEAVNICMEAVRLPYSMEAHDLSTDSMGQYKSYLEEASHAIEECLVSGYKDFLKTERGCLEATKLGLVSPKLYELMHVFTSFGSPNTVLCLIFVDRIITAKVIVRLMAQVSHLAHFAVSYLTGGSSSVDALTPKVQKETLNLFRSGKINLLFTTDVAEEGLDIPNCSTVIRFDLPKTVRSYVQSRGRARQAGSHYIKMLERGNIQQRDLLFGIISSMHSMMDTAVHRESEEFISKAFCDEEADTYTVSSTGASLTADCSISLVYKYCEKLPRDKYFTPQPDFELTCIDGSYACTLTLPPNAAFQQLTGPFSKSSHRAKQLLCLHACKRLHELGALNDHLCPFVEESIVVPEVDEKTEKSASSGSGPGTTKRKELHGTTNVSAMSGSWISQRAGVTLEGYKLSFSCADGNYANFVLLIDAKLDDDVGSTEMNLYLVDKMVKASVSPCGPIQLDVEQVEQAKLYQEFFFNGLFGKLFIGSKSSGEPREFLLKKDENSFWNMNSMYFLLPLELDNESVRINWKGISSSASVVRYMRSATSSGGENDAVVNSDTVPLCVNHKLDSIHMANECVPAHSLKDTLVLAVHTGKIYSVLDVVTALSADSPFDGSKQYASFSDYFNKKYGIVLQHPTQPLLLLKHSHNPHNLLSQSESKALASTSTNKKKRATPTIKPPQNAHIPPELLVPIDMPLDVLKAFYLFPSLMHRMESLMLASQLRREIGYSLNSLCISSALILEAITTLRCCEDFSLERLELLGDSVLKYAVSCSVFLRFPEKHEGQLSALRSRAVCNATLHRVGINRNIQCYIRDAAFDPRRWVAPGHVTLHPAPCKCEIAGNEAAVQDCMQESVDDSLVIGKACDNGHRWLCSKTIADCVEALIGAYYVGGGLPASLVVLKWFGIDAEFDQSMVDKALRVASTLNYVSKVEQLSVLESKLSYEFTIKGLLLEAMTHASHQEYGSGYCYQRLEFLGDSVLDFLITWHLFKTHTEVDPGELTDLRSASVNNENFAQVAVKHKLHEHLLHSSGLLQAQVMEYVKTLDVPLEDRNLLSVDGTTKCPKVLGDIVESISGAMLIDLNLNLDRVWAVFEPLVSPIVTPESLDLPPLRQLTELCSQNGYFLKTSFKTENNMVTAWLEVQLETVLFMRQGYERNKKAAKGKAALELLKDLEKEGYTHSRYPSKRKNLEELSVGESSHKGDVNISTPPRDTEAVEPNAVFDEELSQPEVLPVKTKKGGPRMALYALCKKTHCPMPTFETPEWKPSPEDLSNGIEKLKNVNYFWSSTTISGPDVGVIKCTGERCLDKKSAMDSAALALLYELERRGRCKIVLRE